MFNQEEDKYCPNDCGRIISTIDDQVCHVCELEKELEELESVLCDSGDFLERKYPDMLDQLEQQQRSLMLQLDLHKQSIGIADFLKEKLDGNFGNASTQITNYSSTAEKSTHRD